MMRITLLAMLSVVTGKGALSVHGAGGVPLIADAAIENVADMSLNSRLTEGNRA